MSNVFSFTGAFGKDGELKYLPSGQAVLNVNVANSIGFGDKQQTLWVRVAFFGKRAEGVAHYVKKGGQVFVSGELTVREYQANDGAMKYSLELTANVFDLVGKKGDNANNAPPPQGTHDAAKSNGYAPQQNNDAPYDDDIPF